MANKETKRDVLSAYRFWLNNKVPSEVSSAYNQLLAFLWRTEVDIEKLGYIESDLNRLESAKNLRDEFAGTISIENQDYLTLKKMPVKLIELMISLAGDVSDIVGFDDCTSKYFWEMVASLELNKLDDGNWNISSAQRHVDIFQEHRYKRNGRGGLFFIKDIGPEYNATKLDLWSQANAWLNSKAGRNL